MPVIVLSTSLDLTHFIPTTILWSWHCSYHHFADEDTEAQSVLRTYCILRCQKECCESRAEWLLQNLSEWRHQGHFQAPGRLPTYPTTPCPVWVYGWGTKLLGSHEPVRRAQGRRQAQCHLRRTKIIWNTKNMLFPIKTSYTDWKVFLSKKSIYKIQNFIKVRKTFLI